jgi:glycosyltransferase involved in cell wall biosynthesis
MASVLILTLNEAHNLPSCLASVAGCDDIVVLDSGSTDATVAVAQSAGARVYVHPFTTFACQRNWAHEHITFRHPWVFHLDADERFTPELWQECTGYTGDEPLDACWAAPRMLFRGQWIRHATDFPVWQARFVRWRQFHFIDVGHGQREAPGQRMAKLRANYLHEIMANGEAAWLEKHQRYAEAEAAPPAADDLVSWSDLLHRDSIRRRRALKQHSRALPFRPWLRFVYHYACRRGFLDGPAGWHYCRLLSRYEGFITAEIRRRQAAHTA